MEAAHMTEGDVVWISGYISKVYDQSKRTGTLVYINGGHCWVLMADGIIHVVPYGDLKKRAYDHIHTV